MNLMKFSRSVEVMLALTIAAQVGVFGGWGARVGFQSAFAADEVKPDVEASLVYVKSDRATIRESASLNSKNIVQVTRGTPLQLVTPFKSKDRFVQVREPGGKTGWLSTLFVSREKVVMAADLAQLKAEDPSDMKRLRARTRPKAATMGVRGLRSSYRAADAGDRSPADYRSLEKLDRYEPTDASLQQFKRKAAAAQ
jgi:hypothetical protein